MESELQSLPYFINGCDHVRRKAEFSLVLSSYPASSKSPKKSFQFLLLHVFLFRFAYTVESRASRIEKNLRDLGHCEGLCVALIRYRGILPVSGIAVVIESVQSIRGENFLWGEKPYGKRGTAHVTISYFIEPSVGRADDLWCCWGGRE